jgi:hypothetical protein
MAISRFERIEAQNTDPNRPADLGDEPPVVVRRTAGARTPRRTILEILREHRQRTQGETGNGS